MKKLLTIFSIGACLLFATSAYAQSMSDLKLNEILVTNTNDFQDDYGQQNAWIEIFNIGYGSVDVGGCYLSNDPNNLKKYAIPRGDILTKIKPRQHTLFWADDQAYRGTFHVNFLLNPLDTLYLVSNNGKTILDKVAIPTGLEPNQSYGRKEDGIGDWQVMLRTSPSTNNATLDGLSKSDKMKQTDPYGWIMAVMAMMVVFSALIILFLCFKGIGNLSIKLLQKKANESTQNTAHSVADTSGETYAAIAMALHLYATESDVHDVEETILTINRTRRSYSPWSSKRQSMRQEPILRKR